MRFSKIGLKWVGVEDFLPLPNPGDGHFQLAILPEKWSVSINF